MTTNTRKPAPLSCKSDLDEANRRWEAYIAGEIIDRPLVCVTAPLPGKPSAPGCSYHERVYGDIDAMIDRDMINTEATYYGGEAVPGYWISFGPDEIAVFCGSEFLWNPDSDNTNWSQPIVEDWEAALPILLRDDHPLWQRMLEFYRKAAAKAAGKIAMAPLDLHSNMDILAALRGPEQLCMDLVDQPEMIDRAMADARAVFPKLWNALTEAGRMYELGFSNGLYSMEGAAVLQCDFSCMISPEMFQRWVLPALEEEAAIAKHVFYHWDGPGALVHTDAILASKGLHTLGYVPGDGNGRHIEYLELFKRCQAGGKSVQVWGTPDELKSVHTELKPEKVMYCTSTETPEEAEALLEWFVQHT